MNQTNKNIIVYTDGAYRPSVDQGGWGIVVVKDGNIIYTDFNGKKKTTNNRMELIAVIHALLYLKSINEKEANIMTDSQYVMGCAAENWTRSKNLDLWKIYDKVSVDFDTITVKWTKGHDTNEFNNLADELAVKGSNLLII